MVRPRRQTTAKTRPLALLVVTALSVAMALHQPAAATGQGSAEAEPGRRASEGPGPAGPAEGPTSGVELYRRDCLSCHGVDGGGSWRGPALDDSGTAGTYYMVATGRMPIDDPHEPVRRQAPQYSPDEVRALVAYMGQLVDGPEVPDLDAATADLGLGGRLYRLHCGQCHSATGIGGALLYGKVAPPLLEVEPSVVAAVVVAGPGAMPAFALTDEELVSVVAFVTQVQQPLDEGGLPLGRAGRVDEGLVAWGLGLAGLVLAAGWIARPVHR